MFIGLAVLHKPETKYEGHTEIGLGFRVFRV